MLKIIIAAFFVFGVMGCATCSKNTNTQIQNLQAELDQAKAQLQQKDEQINSLKEELSEAKTNFSSNQEAECVKLSVKQIQAALKNAGYYDGPIDGKIGKNTRQSIKEFQQANGLTVDGVAGKQTMLKLKGYLK